MIVLLEPLIGGEMVALSLVDVVKLKNEFLGKSNNGFQTNNSLSFVRQLNLYGFRKCNKVNDVHGFKSKYFIRGKEDLVKLLKRKLNNIDLTMVSRI